MFTLNFGYNEIPGGTFKWNIGTAGCITMLALLAWPVHRRDPSKETIGKKVADCLIEVLKTKAMVDEHVADQLFFSLKP